MLRYGAPGTQRIVVSKARMAEDAKSYEFFSAHGYQWKAQAHLGALVESDVRFADSGGSHLVKSGPARRVWRVRFEHEGRMTAAYVKECRLPRLRDYLKYLFQPAKAAREFTALLRLRRRGLNAPDPLAVGVRRKGLVLSSSVLVTMSIDNAQPLDRYVLERIPLAKPGDVRGFSVRLAAFLRQVHQAGLFHNDFHGGNVLVRGEPHEAEFHLVDLDDVSIGDALPYGARLYNLAILNHLFGQVVPRHWRLRFLREYLGTREDMRAASRVVEGLGESGMRRVWAKKDRRTHGENKYFRHVMAGRLVGHMRRDSASTAAVGLFDGGDPFQRAEALLKDGRSSTVGVFALPDAVGGRRIVIKRRNRRRDWKRFFDCVRTSRGARGFFAGAAFQNRCLPTPGVLAELDCRRLWCLEASYLTLGYVEGAENLAKAVAGGKASPLFQMIERDRKRFLTDLAHVLRRMHFCGFSMRDLKAANVLVCPAQGGVGIMITDLEDARLYYGRVPQSKAIQNVARLYADAASWGAVSRREAVAFLRAYLGVSDRDTLVMWLRGVSKLSRAKREASSTGARAQAAL